MHAEFVGSTIEHITGVLTDAPCGFRALSYSFSELDPPSRRRHDWSELALKDEPGVFVYSEECQYSLNITNRGVKLDCELVDSAVADALLESLDDVTMSYGFAADPAEWHHRNRLSRRFSFGVHEAWVGMNSESLPGVYWKMLLSPEMQVRLGATLESVHAAAKQIRLLKSGTMLVTFFEDADDWRDCADRLDELCRQSKCIFSKDQAAAEFQSAGDFLSASAVAGKWR